MGQHPRQYLLNRSEQPDELPDEFENHGDVGEYTIYASKHLPITIQRDGSGSIAILGDIFHPKKPEETNDEIVRQLLRNRSFERLQRYSGRYVLLYSGRDQTTVVPDTTCQRRVLYTENANRITSSPKLFLDAFGYEQKTSSKVEEFMSSDAFWENDAAWPGTKAFDKRLTRLLPNHYLNATEQAVHRRPLFQPPVSNREDVLDLISKTLSGTIAAIDSRYNCAHLGLTAGWDSRILLAAAETIENNLAFYTTAMSVDLDDPDTYIPFALSTTLDLDYRVIHPPELTGEFLQKMRENYLNPRISSKLRSTQHHYHNSGDNTAFIGGNGGEIARVYYSVADSRPTPKSLAELYHYPDSKFAREEFAEWLPKAKSYAENTGIDIFDLFYWEQRMGNWSSLREYEGDIAAPGFKPFNNYNLLLSALSIPQKNRSGPSYEFFEELIEQMCPNALSEPLNPISNRTLAGRTKANLNRAANSNQAVGMLKNIYLRCQSD